MADLTARFADWMRQNAPQLNTDASDDLIAQFVRPGQPADVFAALKHLADARFAPRTVSFEERLGHEPHFLEHPGRGAMRSEPHRKRRRGESRTASAS